MFIISLDCNQALTLFVAVFSKKKSLAFVYFTLRVSEYTNMSEKVIYAS